GGLGIALIPYVRNMEIDAFFMGTKPIWLQVLVGIVFGLVTAMAGWQIVELPIMAKTKTFFAGLINPLKLDKYQIVFISICAGVGEELFFRGAIQPMLGIWMTSIMFVLLHGYLNPFNLPLTYYGIYMVLVIGVIGLMTEHLGILTAMIAHTIIDVILLKELSATSLPNEKENGD
ncbi:MAG: CPBP family intramembrane metalloprotease, partial [Cyclobacteriaceae bacterium]|nr:CPBP family intramembrane metalloprotease [Cyclobacteriaceae bacterium]